MATCIGPTKPPPHALTWRHNAAVINLGAVWDRNAPPRTPADADFLKRYTRFAQPAIVAAAVLPLILSGRKHSDLAVIVGIGTWLVFVADFVVQMRRRDNYLRSRDGLIDIVIVVLTSPWYLIPGVNAGAFVTLLRLARLARLVLAFQGARRLIERLGRAAILALAVVLIFSWMAFDAEHPVNPEFASYGDALWWGVVTLTTVGYGDIVPITVEGRIAGVVIMFMGVGLLGVLAGALASFFKLTPQQESEDQAAAQKERDEANGLPEAVDAALHGDSDSLTALTKEVVDLRQQITELTEHVKSRTAD